MIASRNALAAVMAASIAWPAWAQRANENAVTAAGDAFGTSVGNESIGLYDSSDVRGFDPGAAGNIRLDGLYLGGIFIGNPRLLAGSTIHVGLTAQGYPFPAPTGIVDLSLRPAGPKPLLSAVAYDGIHQGLELDGQYPLSPTLSVAGGVGVNRYIDAPHGDYGTYYSAAIAPAWRPRKDAEIRAYYGFEYGPTDVSTPFIFVDGPHLPPRIPFRFQGMPWAAWHNWFDNYGLFGHASLGGGWFLKAGLFEQDITSFKSFNTLMVDTAADGAARFDVAIHPKRITALKAGEIRVTRTLQDGPRRHELIFSVKGRASDANFGGEQLVDLGAIVVGQDSPPFPEPTVQFGAESLDQVRQFSGGIGYHGLWPGVGEVSAGLQKTSYRQTVLQPGQPAVITRADPWLWNGTIAANLVGGLVAYASYTRGLEDSAVAPLNAVNRNEAPPALRTSQSDLGLRYAFGPMRLVVGAFDVQKPYFNVDLNSLYRQLGTVRHRGIEVSLTGEPVKGLSIVAGAVFMRPRVSGPAVDLRLIGPKEVGQPETAVSAFMNYQPRQAPRLSFDLGANYLGPRPGSADDRLIVPGRTLVDLGARYRLNVAHFPATVRLQVFNLFNRYAWNVTGFAGFKREPGRRVVLTLSADL